MPVERVLAIFVPVNVCLSAYISTRYRHLVDRRLLARRVLPWMGAGMVAGMALFHLRGEEWIKAAFGAFVVMLSALELRRTAAATPSTATRTSALVGAGIIHGIFACGGPLLVWVAGREIEEKSRFRATLGAVWLVLGVILLANYRLAGTLTIATLGVSLTLLPSLGLGLLLGERLHDRVPQGSFRRGVFALLLFAGASLFARNL
jgi:uncharacterized membrane protein YfcA